MNEAVNQILDQKPAEETPVDPAQTTATPAQDLQSKPDDRVSSKMEVLIKREQAAIARERAAKDKETEIESKLKLIADFESAKGNSKKALELLGLDYNQLTQSIVRDGEIPPEVQIQRIEEKFDQFKSDKEAEAKARAEDAKKAAEENEQKTIANFKVGINQYLNDNASRYEYISFEAQQDLVFDVIDTHYNRTIDPETGTGKVLSIAEAADKVEQFLEQKYLKAKDLNKTKSLWGAVPKDAFKQAAKPEQKVSQPPKTLTNNLTATQTKPRVKTLTDEDRVQKAIAYAQSLRG